MLYPCPRVPRVYGAEYASPRDDQILREASCARETAEGAENRRATNEKAPRAALAREAVSEAENRCAANGEAMRAARETVTQARLR